MSRPRKNSIVKYVAEDMLPPADWAALIKKNPAFDNLWLYHGRVPNMPGHSVVTSILTGCTLVLHTCNLREAEDDEL